jgi:hypothetical protein
VDEWSYHPVHPKIYKTFFIDPTECPDGSTYYREKMPRCTERITEAIQEDTIQGLYIQHDLLGGRIAVAILMIGLFVFADYWSIKKLDISGGFGIGAYILAAIPIFALFVIN